MPRGIYPREPRTADVIRAVATCRACRWVWRPSSGFISEPCPKCGIVKDVRDRKGKYVTPERFRRMREWRARQPGYSTKATQATRRSALLLVANGDLRCVRCGCDQSALLEINHKNGGGQTDLRGRSQQFYRDIATLKRETDDLELLCKPCNAVHALELVHGPLPFHVVWSGQ